MAASAKSSASGTAHSPVKRPIPPEKSNRGSQLPGIKFRRIFRHPYVIAAKNKNEFRRTQLLLHMVVIP